MSTESDVRIKAARVRDVLAFVDSADGEVRVRWRRRGPAVSRDWRCDACPDDNACDHIDAARRALTEGTE